MALDTRPLGGDGPPVTRLGLGLAALGRPAYIDAGRDADLPADRSPEAMERRTHEVLDAAWAAGIRYVDAARSYGRAEAFLRSWLDARRRAPADLVVGSKWGYRYVGGWRLDAPVHEVKDHSRAALDAQLAESRGLLGPFLALYQIHSATPETGVLRDDAVLDALARLRDGGIRVGVTVSGPAQGATIRAALAIRRGDRPLFAAVQATWNVLERSAEEALREAHATGRTVIVKEALANGRLSPRGDAGASGPLALYARDLGASADQVALAAALVRPWADVVLLGAATPAQVASNAGALAIGDGPALHARLDRMREDPVAYWARRAENPWT